jgi:hypothetical protein
VQAAVVIDIQVLVVVVQMVVQEQDLRLMVIFLVDLDGVQVEEVY